VNLELLRTFVVAARAPTFALAGRARGVSVSAISQQVKMLEAQLSLPLFERFGRNVRLTKQGASLLTAVELNLKSLAEALAEAIEDHTKLSGVVTLVGPRTFGSFYVTPRIQSLLRKHPSLQLSQRFEVPSLAERMLTQGHTDLAILTRPAEVSGLAVAPLWTESFVAVAAPRFVKQASPERTELTLSQWRWLIFDDDLPMHARWWRAQFGKPSTRPTTVAASVASLEHLLDYALAGIGCAVLPDYLVAQPLRQGKLVEITTAGTNSRPSKSARNTLYLAWRESAPDTARVRCVKQALLSPVTGKN
jgi:DNA-binding transcriptional LysR family regulator